MTPNEILIHEALRLYRRVLVDAAYYVPVGSTWEADVERDRAALKRMIKLNEKSELLR